MYAFLQDVERLEWLINKKVDFNFDSNKRVVAAFAVIIAQSKKISPTAYWASQDGKSCKMFSLESNTKIKCDNGKPLSWQPGSSQANKGWPPVQLMGEYWCCWEEYYKDDEYPIKYMIFDIQPLSG